MPEQDKRIELGGSVWMTVGGESLGGSGRVQLLALIGQARADGWRPQSTLQLALRAGVPVAAVAGEKHKRDFVYHRCRNQERKRYPERDSSSNEPDEQGYRRTRTERRDDAERRRQHVADPDTFTRQ